MHRKSFARTYFIVSLLLIAFSLLLFSCGRSSSSGLLAGGGIGGTGISVGTITAFGSVFVSDFEYSTAGTAITVNGVSGTEGELSIGMKVILQALNGSATSIDYEPEIIGPLDNGSVNLANSSLSVLKQNVTVDNSTSYKGISGLTDINDGDILQVSGFINADGSIQATFIALESSSLQEFEIKGTVSNLIQNTSFTINNLTVNYSSSSDLINDGVFVEVEGTVSNGDFFASKIELKNEVPSGSSGEHYELEGTIIKINSQDDFEVNGQPVLTTGQTVYENGTAADVVLNRRVKVEGTVNSNSTIEASKVEFH